jgi:hypothetical protein
VIALTRSPGDADAAKLSWVVFDRLRVPEGAIVFKRFESHLVIFLRDIPSKNESICHSIAQPGR